VSYKEAHGFEELGSEQSGEPTSNVTPGTCGNALERWAVRNGSFIDRLIGLDSITGLFGIVMSVSAVHFSKNSPCPPFAHGS
jgi:hypothetical protein